MNKFLTSTLTLTALPILLAATIAHGQQRPAHLLVNSLLDQLPIAQSSQACYSTCNTTTDQSGLASIKDNGAVFNHLTDELKSLMNADMNAMNTPSTASSSAPAAPTAEQIAQMQQEAMARAQQYSQAGANPAAAMQAQAAANRKPPAANPAMMREIGDAQGASMKIQMLVGELSRKLGMEKRHVPSEPNCPEVRQGSYVGPTCACTYERSITGEQKEVGAEDDRLQAQMVIFRPYLSDIKIQVAIMDKVETDAKYGDGISDPTQLSLLWTVQRQGLSAFTSLLSMASGIWTDGARQYLQLVNAKANHCK